MTKTTSAHTAAVAVQRFVLVFFCDSGVCSVDTDLKKVKHDGIIYFLAAGTSVQLHFSTSPFITGDATVTIPANQFVAEPLIHVTKNTTFHYTFSCGDCGSGAGEADILIEP
jgi:hypothetical protein